MTQKKPELPKEVKNDLKIILEKQDFQALIKYVDELMRWAFRIGHFEGKSNFKKSKTKKV